MPHSYKKIQFEIFHILVRVRQAKKLKYITSYIYI
jgi:hypothetical protein